jgi:hypothetical protein
VGATPYWSSASLEETVRLCGSVAFPDAAGDRLVQPSYSAVATKSASGITCSVFIIAMVQQRSSEKRPIRERSLDQDLALGVVGGES